MDLANTQTYFNLKLYDAPKHEATADDLTDAYENWADTYEQDLRSLGYSAPQYVADTICELCSEKPKNLINILDVGAGTGFLGEKLKKSGFIHIDALEPSAKMLDEANRRDIYETYKCSFITGDPLDIKQGTYDFVTGVGMLGDNHAPFAAIREMARLTKPGGYVILALRRWLVEQQDYIALEPLMKEMEQECTWESVSRSVFPNYYTDVDGIIFVFRVI